MQCSQLDSLIDELEISSEQLKLSHPELHAEIVRPL
jgi:hypothetical protein